MRSLVDALCTLNKYHNQGKVSMTSFLTKKFQMSYQLLFYAAKLMGNPLLIDIS